MKAGAIADSTRTGPGEAGSASPSVDSVDSKSFPAHRFQKGQGGDALDSIQGTPPTPMTPIKSHHLLGPQFPAPSKESRGGPERPSDWLKVTQPSLG